jgi:hypothetical protein
MGDASKSTGMVEYQLSSRFETVRQKLLEPDFAEHLEKPLAFWALPNDRRLPLAFMGRSLRDLLSSSFDELYSTPGIGRKKIHSLVDLLHRAAGGPLQVDAEWPTSVPMSDDGHHHRRGIDPTTVSEAVWAQWRASIHTHGLGKEPLGRFAISLQNLPRVIWGTPLSAYADMSLADMRALKTYGEKRVNAVIEIFGCLHAIVSGIEMQEHLAVHIVPKFLDPLETWLGQILLESAPPSFGDIQQFFVEPLIRQVEIDAGTQVARLAMSRLKLIAPTTTVRQVAHRMGLTRARIYQLLEDISVIIQVRWPAGSSWGAKVAGKLSDSAADPGAVALFMSARELFFPENGAEDANDATLRVDGSAVANKADALRRGQLGPSHESSSASG